MWYEDIKKLKNTDHKSQSKHDVEAKAYLRVYIKIRWFDIEVI